MTDCLPSDEKSARGTRDWPHAPPHRLGSAGVYFVTARAREQRHLLADDSMKNWFHAKFRALADEFNWRLEAWAVLSNHYHFIAHNADGSPNAESLGTMLKKLHSLTTKELNKREETPGRTRLWQNFRDTHLTYQPSYLARLHYVHENAVHHGLVRRGSDYPWCSARPFREAVTPAWVQTVYSFKYDQIAKGDDE